MSTHLTPLTVYHRMLKALCTFAVLSTIFLESNGASGVKRFNFDIKKPHDSREHGKSFVNSSGYERILGNDARMGKINE